MDNTNSRYFDLDICDGMCCAQVYVFNEEDHEHWKNEAKRTNHKMVYDYFIPRGYYMNSSGKDIDVYQILPLDYEVKHG